MDKSWIRCVRTSKTYIDGVSKFLKFAYDNASHEGRILCPCVKCNNCVWQNRDSVQSHMIVKGIDPTYTNWRFHGECSSSSNADFSHNDEAKSNMHDNVEELLHDAYPQIFEHLEHEEDTNFYEAEDVSDTDLDTLKKLLEECRQELYPGAPVTKLTFIVRLFLLKCLHGWSNVSFTAVLEVLNESFPNVKTIPKGFNETRSIMRGLGLESKKIDACKNDCMIFWKEHANSNFCHICGTSRWIENEEIDLHNNQSTDPNVTLYDHVSSPKQKKIGQKILRYFPIKKRLQRLFMCSKTAASMRWHEEDLVNDGKLRHPTDAEAWKHLDSLYPGFAYDSRNVRLGLASDGFNPFRTMSVQYSVWPVILMPYNLPPWMCMKPPNFMMALLIPGKDSPGNNIDVYMQPLIEELKDLWQVGVKTYDSSQHEYFQMRAALLWTINDFLAYAMLSGWSTKGKLACPVCCYDTKSIYLKNSRKFCYPGSRRFLDKDHKWRRDTKSFFRGKEFDEPPVMLSGSDVLQHVGCMENKFGKTQKKRKDEEGNPWKKRSLFFELPYWEFNLLRHNLDVMHIEKNVCDNILGTLLDVQGKSKDHLRGRLDLQEIGGRRDLHPFEGESSKMQMPSASFSLTSKQKNIFCNVLKGVRIPDGYASNIARCVHPQGNKIIGLKSHDCHFVLHHLLQLAVRRVLPHDVVELLIMLGNYFRRLCMTVIAMEDLENLEAEIVEILCRMEMVFPPSFFDIMIHLPIHLVHEIRLGGPVQLRWMYSIERYLGILKSYVRNRSRPEGSIVEGYIAEECLIFCARYLDEDVDTRFNRSSRNFDGVGVQGSTQLTSHGRSLGNGEMFTLNEHIWIQAHRYVLFNTDTINEYIEEHREIMENFGSRGKTRKWDTAFGHSKEFHVWFKSRVKREQVSEEIKWLSRGPHNVARRFNGYVINGYRFRIESRDIGKKTQNCGVGLTSATPSFASSKDSNPVFGDVTYYGKVTEIIELNYYEHHKCVLMKCDWFHWKTDEFNLPMVNFSKRISQNDPFVFASQVYQVFYVQDPIKEDWHNVVKITSRDCYDTQDGESHDFDEPS